jgi:hypothetical protein
MKTAVVRGKQAVYLGVGRDAGEDQADPKNKPERVSHDISKMKMQRYDF